MKKNKKALFQNLRKLISAEYKKIGAIFIIISTIFSFGILLVLMGHWAEHEDSVGGWPQTSPASETVSSAKDEIKGWQIYRNEKYGFEFMHPKDWKIKEDKGRMMSENYIDFIEILPEQDRISGENPNGTKLFYPGIQIYKSEKSWDSEINDLNSRLKGESENIRIDGVDGMKKEGEITEHLSSYGSRRIEVILKQDDNPFVISAFDYDKEIFNQILSTFKFIETENASLSYGFDWSTKDCTSFIENGGFGLSSSEKKDCDKWIDFGDEQLYYKFIPDESLKDYFCSKDPIRSGYYFDSPGGHFGCGIVERNTGYENISKSGYVCQRYPCGPVMCGDSPAIESCEFRDVFIAYTKNPEYPIVTVGRDWGKDCFTREDIEEINKMYFSAKYDEMNLLMQKKYEECSYKNAEGAKEFDNYIKRVDLSQKEVLADCPSSVTDIDNNVYNTVKIGPQCWMKENLKVTKNPAGEAITRYCYSDDPKNCKIDGGLYDWNTAMDGSNSCNGTSANPSCLIPIQGICPSGWHLPSHYEWTALEKNSGFDPEAFPFDEATIGWLGKNEGANLKSGIFGAGFGGQRELFGSFENNGSIGYFWSSTETCDGAFYRTVHKDDSMMYRDVHYKDMGFSVRCIKN